MWALDHEDFDASSVALLDGWANSHARRVDKGQKSDQRETLTTPSSQKYRKKNYSGGKIGRRGLGVEGEPFGKSAGVQFELGKGEDTFAWRWRRGGRADE